MLDLLDRIVVETSPPATFTHEDAVGNTHRIGKKGVAVLAMGPTGAWHADDGRLIDRILADKGGCSVVTPSSFTSELSQNGYHVNTSDLDIGSEIVVFAYAATLMRISDELGAMARQVLPASCKAFSANAESYCAISLLPAEKINHRSLLSVGRELHGAARGDAIRHLAIGMLQQRPNDRAGLLMTWAKSDRVDDWAVLAAAMDATICDAATAGLITDSSAIAMLLGDGETALARDISVLAKQVNTLMMAGILSSDAEDALEDVSEIDVRSCRLDGLRQSAIAAVSSLDRQLGPFAELSTAENGFLESLSRIGVQGELGGYDRVTQFFAEQVEQKLQSITGSKPDQDFCEKLGQLLRQSVDEDARQVEQLVALGLTDPIKLTTDNVVAIGMSEGPAAGFVSATLDDASVAWLNSSAPAPAIVEQWRHKLRATHDEKKALRKTTVS